MQLLTESSATSTLTTTPSSSATNANAAPPPAASGNMGRFYPPKPKINAFNELFKCHLCQGYMINPTTIDACMHTYCRSCIARHLAVDCYCPQCKGNGGKALTISNLKSDDVLRSIIYKLVPGLYQKERERIVQFVNNTKNEGQFSANASTASPTQEVKDDVLESEDDLFSPTDPISLSLEYHPFLAKQCPESAVPPVRYLQCPASVKIQHLKRFLCSKFDIDPCNRRVGIEIIYEDEVLPNDFTLMDVGYCYQWKRNAPLKFLYRILIYSEEQTTKPDDDIVPVNKVSDKSCATYLGQAVSTPETNKSTEKSPVSLNGDTAPEKVAASPFLPPAPLTTKLKSSKSSASKHVQSSSLSSTPSVKMTITSRPIESKKSVSKRSSASTGDFVLPTTNDFKSLRSNDIRYSHYAVTATTTAPPPSAAAPPVSVTSTKTKVKLSAKEEKPAKCDIVVSIPLNQMHDEWESKPLSQLKTASKKSPNPPTGSITSTTNLVDSTSTVSTKKVKNVPKLKIELNSLKTKLIEKPKSADIRLDTLLIKHHKPRKFSLDDAQPQANDKVDLETYVKNIGLKPIEVQTNAATETELPEKFTPNASPRSSCSSSTTSSSNGYLHLAGEISTSSSSSHKKRKKKHSREPRDSKRKKLHAEISSHTDEESLKMKVKLTAPLNIKPSKFESKKSPSVDKTQDPLAFVKTKSSETKTKILFEKPFIPAAKPKDIEKERNKSSSSEKHHRDPLKLKPLAIKTSSTDFEDDDDIVIPDTTTSSPAASFSKPLTNLIESQLPHSPPLPPSLFKTTPLTFSTFAPNAITVAKPKPAAIAPKHAREKPVQSTKMKPLAPKPMPVKHLPAPMKPPQFAVPNLPRLMASNSSKFLTSTPSSIASAANKQMGNLLKRSISLDEAKTAKQSKMEKPHQITVSAYGSNLQVTRVEIPATPTSSTAKATFEIPLYSPLSASYNPKCSFTVGSSTSVGKTVPLPMSLNSGVPNSTASKSQMFTTSAAVKKSEKELKKLTTSSTAHSGSKTSPLMGPPLSIAKLNTVVPATIKSPPLPAQPTTTKPATNAAVAVPPVTVNSGIGGLTDKKSSTEVMPSNVKATNGPLPVEKPKSSLRQFRLPSRESAQDILDLSPAPKSVNGLQAGENKLMASANIPASPTTTTGSSLELALTKIKQNITNNVSQDSKPSALDLKPNSDDLQNLHLLSESATAREKIAISAPKSSAATSSLYEKPKINQNSLVRQQNASVRNIPNPSALAFRNHQPTNNIPMVTIAAPLVASLTNDADKPLLSSQIQPSSPHSPLNIKPQSPTNYSTSANTTTSPPRTTTTTALTSKRHPSIDQVAASLNIRASAAAAAEASAKANLKQLDERAVVTSTSTLAEIGGGNKLKQIKQETVEQTATTTPLESARPSSTVHSSATTSSQVVVEIKKEPEDRFNETMSSSLLLAAGDEQRDVKAVLATTTTSALAVAMAAAAPSSSSSSVTSKVENLVTSVINVSTPTSTLLTATSAGF